MFANLIFLILVLFVVNLAPSVHPKTLGLSDWEAFSLGMSGYILVIFAILLIARLVRRFQSQLDGAAQLLTHLILIAFLVIFHLILGAHRFYSELVPFSQSTILFTLPSLLLYFAGLSFHYFLIHENAYPKGTPARIHGEYALNQVRFVLPFLLPFLIYQGTLDLLGIIPSPRMQAILNQTGEYWADGVIMTLFTIAFLGMLMVFLPAMIQRLWRCQPLPEGPLKDRLEALCQRAGFKHAGMKLWTVMSHNLTAAIIGVVPRFRYVMFTEGLLEELSPEEVEAVLAHEIGHSYYRHLLIYPFIFLGMMLSGGLFFLFMHDSLAHFFAIQEQLGNGTLWRTLEPVAIFLPYAIIMGLYFRLVFGYFSRLFERQADIHPLSIGVQGEDMINALNRVGVLSGNTHHHPSWHHFSLQQRMEFLFASTAHPDLAQAHHRRVKRNVLGYFLVLGIVSSLFLAQAYPKAPGLVSLNQWSRGISQSLNMSLNEGYRQELTQRYQEHYKLRGDPKKVQTALEESLQAYEALTVRGVAEFYAAQRLFNAQEYGASLVMMTAAWEKFDFNQVTPDVPEDFRTVTYRILQAAEKEPGLLQQRLTLFQAMQDAREGLPYRIDSHSLVPIHDQKLPSR